ncbi:ATP-binding protein [Oxalobacteraceae bacterium A2-2]
MRGMARSARLADNQHAILALPTLRRRVRCLQGTNMLIGNKELAYSRQILIALVLVAVATAAQLLLSLLVGARAPFLIFIPTVALAATLFGDLAATVVLLAGAVYGLYILGPIYRMGIHDPADRIVILLFLIVGAFFVGLGRVVRQTFRRAGAAERALAEERLNREVETLAVFQEMFNQAPGFMTMLRGPDHVYAIENEAHRRFHGHRDVIGRPVASVFPELADQGINQILDEVYRSGVPFTADGVALQLRRGPQAQLEQLYMDLVCQPLKDKDGRTTGIFVEGFDVTAQHTMRQALEESHQQAAAADQRLQLAVEAASLGVFYCPLPLDKVYWNDTCKAQFFQPPDAEIDIDLFYSVLHEDDRPKVAEAIRRAVFEQADYDVEYRTVAPDGRTRWIRAKGKVYYDGAGQPSRFDGITIDIQQQKEAEAALQAANRQKDEFLAMLAHELRNPLAPISSASGFLMRSSRDEQAVRMSQIIDRQVRHMAGLLDDLLDVARVTRGNITLDRAPVDLKTTLADAAEQVLPLVKRRSHQLTVHACAEPAVVLGDAKRLIQVFVNLLTNAARYTPQGGVIDMTLSVAAGRAMVEVRDNGMGLTEDMIPRLFDLFVQGERGVDRQQGGLGIGLSLVLRLTELHGGTVEASSPGPGQGSRFIVALPLLEAGAAHASAPAAAESGARPRKITIVDDNEDAARTLAALLAALGHTAAVETDPVQALAKAAEAPAEAYLLDIGMPVMDGYTLARKLREHPATRDARIIAVSGYGQEQDRKQALSAGFDDLAIKPVDLDRLLALLQ